MKHNISPLKENGIVHSNPANKADILNQQFKSVFVTTELLPNSTFTYMPDIEITEDCVL